MFNEELKKRYINEKNKLTVLPTNYLECQFNKVEKFEIDLNKDISEFTLYEIVDYYKTLNTSSLEVLTVLNSHLSMYTQWCLQNNLVKDNQNHFLEMDVEQTKRCINKAVAQKKIITRDQILQWCDQLPNPKDQLVILGLFEGMKGKDYADFVNLKPEDVDGNVLTLYDGRKIEVSDKLISYIQNSLAENVYYACTGNQIKVMPLIFKGYVIKSYPNIKEGTTPFMKGRIIYNSIVRSLNYIGVMEYMSAQSLYESGKIDMIKTRAKQLGIAPKEYLYSDNVKEVELKYNCKIVRSVFYAKYEDCLH